MAEMFLPKFGQELAAMTPLLAGMFGATVSVGWSVVQLFSASADRERTRRRLMLLGPVLMPIGLAVFAATQHAQAKGSPGCGSPASSSPAQAWDPRSRT